MRIRTTVSLDDDVLERMKQESRKRGNSFQDTLNGLLRSVLLHNQSQPKCRHFKNATHMGWRPELNYDNIEGLSSYAEGEQLKFYLAG